MQPVRRLTAILLNVLLIQVSLAGFGATGAEASEAMRSGTGDAIAMTHVADVPTGAERACAETMGDDAGCPRPCAPEGCAAMTACAATACAAPAVPVGAIAAGALARRVERAWGDPAHARPSPRPAPDRPPPRA